MEKITATCFKCPKDLGEDGKKKSHQTEIQDPKIVTIVNNRKQAKGYCSECGGKVSKFVPMKTPETKSEEIPESENKPDLAV